MTTTVAFPRIWGTCTHEASHAVVLAHYGFPVMDVSVVPDVDTLGRCHLEHGWHTERPLHAAVGLISGVVGEAVFTGRDLEDLADNGGRYDLDAAHELCFGIHHEGADRLIHRAGRLVERHRAAIQDVAVELMFNDVLTGPQLTEILRLHPVANRTRRTP